MLGGTEENSVSPDKGSLICPSVKSIIFYKKETEKIELLARPGFQQGRDSNDVANLGVALTKLPVQTRSAHCRKREFSNGFSIQFSP